MKAAVGRNEPCTCGSGRKYKLCCGASRAPTATPVSSPVSAAKTAVSGRNWAAAAMRAAVGHAQAGRLREAESACSQALAAEPDNAVALSFSGEVALRLNNLNVALHQTRRAVELVPDNATYRCALGDVYRAVNRPNEAITEYRAAWQLAPTHPSASNRVISLLMEDGRIEEAVAHFGAAMAADPRLRASHSYLLPALAQLDSGKVAIESTGSADEIAPVLVVACHALRHALNSTRRLADPAADGGRSQMTEVSCGFIYMNLHNWLVARKRFTLALSCMHALAAIESDNATARHIIAALSGAPLERASQQYCASLFDACAAEFDDHLTRQLGYNAPQRLAEVARELAAAPPGGWDILDLGCGTGLVGLALRSCAKTLVGVDLSAGMLGQARQRQLYTRLEKSDLLDFLQHEPDASYDIIVAADVFIYLGALDAIFERMRGALRANGLAVFSIELLEAAALATSSARSAQYALTISGRFAQSRGYIEELAAHHGFTIEKVIPVVLRTEGDAQVAGLLYGLRRQ